MTLTDHCTPRPGARPAKILFVLTACAAVFSLVFFEAPFAWASFLFFLGAALAALLILARKEAIRNLLLCCLTLTLSLAALELYLGLRHQLEQPGVTPQVNVPPPPFDEAPPKPGCTSMRAHVLYPHPQLGFGPKAEAAAIHERMERDGDLIYDVTYRTLPSGWRVTPQRPGADTAVVVFGCSFTWGGGLEDRESFPWKLGEMLGEGYQVFNFGFPGYGSHQMLAQIENGILDDIAGRYATMRVFYSTIQGHQLRSSGYSPRDPHSPWYVLENGAAVRKGVLGDKEWPVVRRLDAWLGKSMCYIGLRNMRWMSHAERNRLHAGLIKEAEKQLQRRYQTELTVMLWPEAGFVPNLKELQLTLLDLTPLHTGYKENPAQYWLHPKDRHPGPKGTDIAARALADYILEQEKASSLPGD